MADSKADAETIRDEPEVSYNAQKEGSAKKIKNEIKGWCIYGVHLRELPRNKAGPS